MKNTNLLHSATAIMIAGALFASCQSSTPKIEAAETKVQDAEQALKEAKKAATAEEWNAFKEASETRIKANEVLIDDLRAKMKVAGKKIDATYEKSINELEERNQIMKNKIATYNNDSQSDWVSFKREFNHDMDGLWQALKDVGVNNKK